MYQVDECQDVYQAVRASKCSTRTDGGYTEPRLSCLSRAHTPDAAAALVGILISGPANSQGLSAMFLLAHEVAPPGESHIHATSPSLATTVPGSRCWLCSSGRGKWHARTHHQSKKNAPLSKDELCIGYGSSLCGAPLRPGAGAAGRRQAGLMPDFAECCFQP